MNFVKISMFFFVLFDFFCTKNGIILLRKGEENKVYFLLKKGVVDYGKLYSSELLSGRF